MDFGSLLHAAKRNENSAKKEVRIDTVSLVDIQASNICIKYGCILRCRTNACNGITLNTNNAYITCFPFFRL
jgi:hypothetical protein